MSTAAADSPRLPGKTRKKGGEKEEEKGMRRERGEMSRGA